MAHLLMIELPGGNDTDLIEAALRQGHDFVFLTQDLSVYQRQAEVAQWVDRASEIIEVTSFDMDEVKAQVLARHARVSFDAVLCLIDIRLIEAAELAQALGLRFIAPTVARLLRDKFSVRERLLERDVAQPPFALVTDNAQMVQAIQSVGFPVLIKPSDGYGSQNIMTIQSEEELALYQDVLTSLLPISTDYGLGVRSNDRLLVERYMKGHLIGCDTLSLNGRHTLLGVNEKLMFAPPSFAIKGGCFMPNHGEWPGLEKYLFALLDAVDFDCGAAHIEVMVTADGPRLVELNPRLVGAKIARLMTCALGHSVHELLIDVHLGRWPVADLDVSQFKPAVTRWLVAQETGVLQRIDLPPMDHPAIAHVEMLAQAGAKVSPPFENVHRLGYVMTCDASREVAEDVAQRFVEGARVVFNSN